MANLEMNVVFVGFFSSSLSNNIFELEDSNNVNIIKFFKKGAKYHSISELLGLIHALVLSIMTDPYTLFHINDLPNCYCIHFSLW